MLHPSFFIHRYPCTSICDAQLKIHVDLPPAKRRRGITGSIISTAFSAALIGTAVGLTVYRLWRDRGKEPEQQLPPPPYQQGDWVQSQSPGQAHAHEQNAQMSAEPPTTLVTPATPSHRSAARRPRQSPATVGRRAGGRHRKTPSVRHAHIAPQRSISPTIDPRFDFAAQRRSEDDEVDVDDQMDWMGDKLAQLIEDGKRALGREVVVASETAEDEVDDGQGEWEELDYDNARAGPSSSSSTPYGSTRRRGNSRSRPSPLFAAPSTSSSHHSLHHTHNPSSRSHPNSARASPRSATFQISEFGQVHGASTSTSAGWDIPGSARSTGFREDNASTAGMSPALRESMESARAAYLAKRNASQSSGLGLGLGLQ